MSVRILDVREVTKPIASPIRNAYIDFSKMTTSLVAVVTDAVRNGRRVVGYGFNSNPAYQPISPLRVDGTAGESGGACGGAAERADHAGHVAPMIGCPAEGPEVVGQMLGREQLVCRLQGGAEIGDQGVDVEERRIALALRTFAAGDGGDVGASALAEDVESRRTVGVHQSAGGNVGIAEDGRF